EGIDRQRRRRESLECQDGHGPLPTGLRRYSKAFALWQKLAVRCRWARWFCSETAIGCTFRYPAAIRRGGNVGMRFGLAIAVLLISTVSGSVQAEECVLGPRVACAGVDLSQREWRRADLAGADLSGADLSGSDLREADLYRANLAGANLSGADLREAILNRSDLSGADLSGARLDDAQIRGAKLEGANLTKADISRLEMSYAELGGATWVDGRVCAEGSLGACK